MILHCLTTDFVRSYFRRDVQNPENLSSMGSKGDSCLLGEPSRRLLFRSGVAPTTSAPCYSAASPRATPRRRARGISGIWVRKLRKSPQGETRAKDPDVEKAGRTYKALVGAKGREKNKQLRTGGVEGAANYRGSCHSLKTASRKPPSQQEPIG